MFEIFIIGIQKFYLLHYKQRKPWLCWFKCTAVCALAWGLYVFLPHFNAQFSPSMLLEIANILHQTFPHLPDTFTEAHHKW